MEFIIITGYSGAGMSVAQHALEDIGYYCIANLPPELIETFYRLCLQSAEHFNKVAVVVDIRGGESFAKLSEILNNSLDKNEMPFKLLFIDASRNVRLHRFKETRRIHPLIDEKNKTIDAAMDKEAELLAPLRSMADIVIDSTYLKPTEMRQIVINTFLDRPMDSLTVVCTSFGFKNGIPSDADLVFDVRCLPNPYYIPELKYQTGLDAPVRDYVFSFDETNELLQRLISLIDYATPLYVKEGKRRLVIAIGCTGGHHRSVAIAQYIAEHLRDNNIQAYTSHRDIHR